MRTGGRHGQPRSRTYLRVWLRRAHVGVRGGRSPADVVLGCNGGQCAQLGLGGGRMHRQRVDDLHPKGRRERREQHPTTVGQMGSEGLTTAVSMEDAVPNLNKPYA